MTTSAPPAAPRSKRRRSNRDFWQATRFLWPYRRTVAISVVCALFTGGFTAAGLATLIPILRVLVRGQTVQEFAHEISVAHGHPGETAHWYQTAYYAFSEHAHSLLERAASFVPTDPVYAVATVFCFVLVLGVFGSISRFFQEYLSEKTAIVAINDIRKKLYDHMLHLPLAYFTKNGSSDLTARLVTDAMGLQEGFKTILGKAVQQPITAAGSLALAMWIDWRLTVFIIVFAPVMVVVIRKLGKKVRRATRAALERNAAMLGQIESSFVGVRVVKSATAEPFERRRYRQILETLRVEQNRAAKYDAWSTPLLEMLGLIAAGCVLIFASYLVFRDKSLDAEQLITLMICLVTIAEPLRQLSKLNAVLQKGNAAATRIYEILHEPTETRGMGFQPISADHGLKTRATFEDAITFEHLTFAYPGTSQPALSDVALTVRKGTSIAIVGRNGSGKTTLLSLLPRFFEPDLGAIKIDGVDIRKWSLRKLRRMIGIVTQEAVLFPGTIAQNIAYADPTRTIEQITSAARRASAHDFILQKPNGYDAVLDGLGGQLSGGQRQRINIARAILRDTPILILDEATSQVDAESEHLIQNAIGELMKDRTTFVIAHRFSTILSADVIIVMEAGRIVGSGKHEELLATCETYKQLYERQLVG